MKKLLFLNLFILGLSIIIFPQNSIITVFEGIKIKNNKRAETLFYYENNWRAFRFEAIKKGYIHSFEIIESKANEKAEFDIALITRYSSKEQFEKSEENFQKIIKQSDGLKILNDLKPNEFRENVFVKIGTSKFTTKSSKVSKNEISNQCNSAELKFFDFLLGNWKGADGKSKIKTIRILEGCGIQEFWEEKESDSNQIFFANLIRTFDTKAKKWHLTFVTHNLTPQIWEGRFESGNWIFYRDWELNGKPRKSRTYWKKASNKGFERIVEQLNDDRKTWRLHVKSIYEKSN